MIERHITFDVHPDRTGDFERYFAETYRPAMATARGYVKAELLREAESLTRYQLVFRFEDAESAAAWRTSELHQGLQPELESLNSGKAVQGYEVIC